MTSGSLPKHHRWCGLLSGLLLSLLLVGCAGSNETSALERIQMVKVRAGDDPSWSRTGYDDRSWQTRRTEETPSQQRIVWIRTPVGLEPRQLGKRPLGVHVSALAAYEVFWNGRLIGRSGSPAPSAAAERQGEVDGHFAIPPDLLRAGDNLLAVRLSSFHLPMRVKHSLLQLSVGDYQVGSTQTLRGYVAAIITAGVLLLGGVYFGFAYLTDRINRGALLLALLSLTLLVQLSVEVSRAFVGYPYGLHLWRVGAIFVLASLFSVLLVAYVRQEFWRDGGRWLIWAVVFWCPAAFFLFGGFDDRTYAVILGSAAAAAVAAGPAALTGSRAALLTLVGSVAMTLPLVGAFPAFLDQDFYVIASALIAGLCLHRALQEPVHPIVPAVQAVTEGDDVRLPLLSARSVELWDPRSFLMIKGADDYAEIILTGGATRLHRGRLSELEARLPQSFLRVHRSYIVNMDRALELSSSAGSLRIRLEEGAWAPVSRTYVRDVRARFRNEGSRTSVPLRHASATGE